MTLQTHQLPKPPKPVETKHKTRETTQTLDKNISQEIRRHYSVLADSVMLTSQYRNGCYSGGISVYDEHGLCLEPLEESSFDELFMLRGDIVNSYGNGHHQLCAVDNPECPW